MADTDATNTVTSAGAGTAGKRNASSGSSATGAAAGDISAAAAATGSGDDSAGGSSEARSRFNAALEEAKAGVGALREEARGRATAYGSQARERGQSLAGDVGSRASDLAVQGKARASEAIAGLARIVSDNAAALDDNLGSRYGDYARSASQSLQDTAKRLDEKSIEELGNDAREFVRNSPGAAVGLAAVAGFLFARVLRK